MNAADDQQPEPNWLGFTVADNKKASVSNIQIIALFLQVAIVLWIFNNYMDQREISVDRYNDIDVWYEAGPDEVRHLISEALSDDIINGEEYNGIKEHVNGR